jgi:hypothetical protein
MHKSEQYYGSLTAFGVNSIDTLTTLTMQDYSHVGITSMDDRKSKPCIIISSLLINVQNCTFSCFGCLTGF